MHAPRESGHPFVTLLITLMNFCVIPLIVVIIRLIDYCNVCWFCKNALLCPRKGFSIGSNCLLEKEHVHII